LSDLRPISYRFPKSARLLKRSDFLRVQGRGRKVHGRYFLLSVLPTPSDVVAGAEQRPPLHSDPSNIKSSSCKPARPLSQYRGEGLGEGQPQFLLSRFGFTISKKTLKSSVKRNQVRRRLREAVRLARSHIRGGFDVVLVAKQGVDDISFRELADELKLLLDKSRLWQVAHKV